MLQNFLKMTSTHLNNKLVTLTFRHFHPSLIFERKAGPCLSGVRVGVQEAGLLNNTIRLKLVFTLGRFPAQKRPHYTCLGHTPQIWSFVYKHKLTGQILGWVFNSRRCQLYVMHLICSNVQHGLRVVNLAQTTFVRYLTTRIISINVLGCHGKEGLVKTCANLRQNFTNDFANVDEPLRFVYIVKNTSNLSWVFVVVTKEPTQV